MTTTKEVIAKKTIVEHHKVSSDTDFNIWFVANGIFFSDNTAYLRLSVVDDESKIGAFDEETITFDGLTANELAAFSTEVTYIDNLEKLEMDQDRKIWFMSNYVYKHLGDLRLVHLRLFTDLLCKKSK